MKKIKIKVEGPESNESQLTPRIGNWDIEEADSSVTITVEDGGTIDDFGGSGSSERIVARYNHQTKMVLVVTFCVGFLGVLGLEIALGTITLKMFIEYGVWLLAGFGLSRVGNIALSQNNN